MSGYYCRPQRVRKVCYVKERCRTVCEPIPCAPVCAPVCPPTTALPSCPLVPIRYAQVLGNTVADDSTLTTSHAVLNTVVNPGPTNAPSQITAFGGYIRIPVRGRYLVTYNALITPPEVAPVDPPFIDAFLANDTSGTPVEFVNTHTEFICSATPGGACMATMTAIVNFNSGNELLGLHFNQPAAVIIPRYETAPPYSFSVTVYGPLATTQDPLLACSTAGF